MPSTLRSPDSKPSSGELAIPPGLSPTQRLAWATKAKRLADLRAQADARRTSRIDTFAALGYVPTTRQAEFHEAAEWDVLYGGAAGGGKTRALLMEGLRACVRYPGIWVGGFRRTYDELKESFLKELALVDFGRSLGAEWNGTEHELRFANGSLLRFRYLERVADATRRQGGEYQLVLLDERTLIPPEAVDILVNERIRTSRADVPVLGVRSGSNPGGIGHSAVKERFIEATDYGTHPAVDDQGRTVRFIQAKVDDNPHLMDADPAYVRRLDAIADPQRRRAMRDGDWDAGIGLVFSEWRRDRHVVAPFPVPESWLRYAGIDWGWDAPWAVEWAAVDEDRRVWVYRERYARLVGETEQARRILEAEGALDGASRVARVPTERVRMRLADPSMWNSRGEVNPISMVYQAGGCLLTKATNDRLAGVQRVHSYLADAPACRMHREMGWGTCPRLHVFDTCPDLIRTLPGLPADPHRPEDVDTDAEDHAYDALRYLLMQLGVPRSEREHRRPPDTSTMDGRVAAELERLRRPKRRNTHDVLGSL